MYSDKYCKSVVKNIEKVLQKKVLCLTCKYHTPLRSGYNPEDDDTADIKADGMQWYQDISVQLRWAVELGRVDIIL